MFDLRRPLSLILSIIIAAAGLPFKVIAASDISASTLNGDILDAREVIKELYAASHPDTDADIENFGEDIIDELSILREDFADLDIDADMGDGLALRYNSMLLILEVIHALDTLEIDISESQRDTFDSTVDDVWKEIGDYVDAMVLATLLADHELCIVEAVGSTNDFNDAASALLGEIESELGRLEGDAAIANTSGEIKDLYWRTKFTGYYADITLQSLFRLNGDDLDDRSSEVDDIITNLQSIQTKVDDALTADSALDDDLDIMITKIIGNLEDRISSNEDETLDKYGSDWSDDRESHFDETFRIINDLGTDIENRNSNDAKNATTIDAHLELRLLTVIDMLLARHAAQSLRVPIIESEAEDLWDEYDNLASAIDDLIDELRVSAPALSDLHSETDDLFNDNSRLGYVDYDSSQSILKKTAFPDMPTDNSFLEAIDPLVAYRVIRGNGNKLLPNNNVSRFEFIKMLLKSTCTSPGPYYNNEHATEALKDFYAKDWPMAESKPLMAKAVADHIISGYGDGNLYPDKPITRFEAAKILSRFYSVKTVNGPVTGGGEVEFADVKPGSGEVATYVYSATAAGFFRKGTVDYRYFRPNDNLSRAEAMKIMWNAFSNRGYIFVTIDEKDYASPDDSIY
jgi:hypothetical protein